MARRRNNLARVIKIEIAKAILAIGMVAILIVVANGILSDLSNDLTKMTKHDRQQVKKNASNSKKVKFEDACKAAEKIGFSLQGEKSSYQVYMRPGEGYVLNFENRNGYIADYQAIQLMEMLEKYGKTQ